MFKHIFKYRLKELVRTKELIFWTLAFPILLAFFFNLAFSNLDSSEGFDPIDAAFVVKSDSQNDLIIEVMDQVSTGEDRLFNLQKTSLEEAKILLLDGAIKGYMVESTPLELHVTESGLSQNIMRLFLDNLNQTTAAITKISQDNPQSMEAVLSQLGSTEEYIEEAEKSTAPPSQILNYFYTLIAMACMYGAFFGSDEVTHIQANITDLAARLNLAPVHKMKAFLASSMASYFVLLFNMSILLLFLRFVLGIDFGDQFPLVVLAVVIGSLTGITFGGFISSLVKKGENLKVSIIIGVTMTGSFLAGMMFAQMKYIISANVPILSYINPVNLIADSFYSLYYYNTLDRYVLNISLLLVMNAVFCLGIYLVLRRRKYASL